MPTARPTHSVTRVEMPQAGQLKILRKPNFSTPRSVGKRLAIDRMQ